MTSTRRCCSSFRTATRPGWWVSSAGTGFLLALAPGSVLLLTSGVLFARNVVGTVTRGGLSDRTTLLVSRLSMIGFAAVAVWLTIGRSQSLVDILLNAYSAIGMLAPAVVLAFLWRRTSAIGVLLGLVAGFTALLAPFAKDYWAAHLPEWEPGLIAMAINAVVVLAVSLITPRPEEEAVAVGLALSAEDCKPPAESTRTGIA